MKLIQIFLLFFSLQPLLANLTISKVHVRMPKPNDIGLIFDLTFSNSVKELLELSVRAVNACRLDLGDGSRMSDAGRIVGGYFGCIEPGATEVISLIWPTVSLYNRVGCCPVGVTSTNVNNETTYFKTKLHFDTKFATLDPKGTGLRQTKHYKDCNNYDLEYLRNCTPVNCEERYFGRRSYFNAKTQHCEQVPRCADDMIYDPFFNECIESHMAITDDDIYNIKMGNFREYDDWLKELSQISYAYNELDLNSNMKSVPSKRESTVNLNLTPIKTNEISDSTLPYWLKGIIDGLMIVFATLGIYVFVCFLIFLLVTCVSRRQTPSERCSVNFSATPSVSERAIPLLSQTSLLTHR